MDSHKSTINGCQLIEIRSYSDNRGYLSVIENNIDVPFEIKRIYYLYMVPEVARGAHAHKELRQLLIATSGSVEVIMDDGTNKKSFILDKPWMGLLIPPGLWRDLENFTKDAVLLCLGCLKYDANGYILYYGWCLAYRKS